MVNFQTQEFCIKGNKLNT